MTESLLLAKIAGVAFAAVITGGMLASVDRLAHDQHAAVQMASQAASTPATTAARRADGQRI